MNAIEIKFNQAGNYFLSDRQGSISLGHCDNEQELREAVQQCVNEGNSETSWDGWTVSYAPVANPTVYCGGCGDSVESSEAIYHGGVPYCQGCEDAPSEE